MRVAGGFTVAGQLFHLRIFQIFINHLESKGLARFPFHYTNERERMSKITTFNVAILRYQKLKHLKPFSSQLTKNKLIKPCVNNVQLF